MLHLYCRYFWLSAENDKNNNSVSKESSDDETVKLCKMCMVRHSHAGKSLPWTISNIDGYGKCLVSTRTIKPLEVVVADTAVLTAPISKVILNLPFHIFQGT